jgi:hypothetical protein
LSPFASRYASTAGTRSAALALIATVGGRLRRAATRCEPSPNLGGGFREKSDRKSAFSSRFLFTALLHAHLVLHKVKSKIRDCAHIQTSFRENPRRGRATRVTRVRFRGRNRASSKSSSFSRKRALST